LMSASMCLQTVCLVRSHISKTIRPNFTKFLIMSIAALARSSTGGVAIRYVGFPVLWMSSHFHTMNCTVRRVYSKAARGHNSRNYSIHPNQIFCSTITKDRQVHVACCSSRTKFDILNCSFLGLAAADVCFQRVSSFFSQIFRRHDQRHKELLSSADVLEHAERRFQHAVPRFHHLPLLRLHFADRHVRRTHGTEDRRTYGRFHVN